MGRADPAHSRAPEAASYNMIPTVNVATTGSGIMLGRHAGYVVWRDVSIHDVERCTI
jgi:hypothetical protein